PELRQREDVEAALLPLGDHQAPGQLVAVLRGKEEPPLRVEPRRMGAEEHRPHLPRSRCRDLFLHNAPLYSTLPHRQQNRALHETVSHDKIAGQVGWSGEGGDGGAPRARRRRALRPPRGEARGGRPGPGARSAWIAPFRFAFPPFPSSLGSAEAAQRTAGGPRESGMRGHVSLGTHHNGAPRPGGESADPVLGHAFRIRKAIETVIEGKPEVVRMALTVLLAEGHLLIEDVPGVGKTMLAKALGRAVDGTVQRIQFTPDLLPGDIT